MTITFSRIAAPVAAAVLALSLAACSSDDSKTDDPATTAPAVTTEATVESTPEATAEAPSGDQGAALSKYVAQAQAQIPGIKEQGGGIYDDITITAEGDDTLVFTYVYSEAIDPATVTDYFDSMADTLQTVSESSLFPEMVQAGITVSPKVRYAFLNPDGSEIWVHTFEQP